MSLCNEYHRDAVSGTGSLLAAQFKGLLIEIIPFLYEIMMTMGGQGFTLQCGNEKKQKRERD